VDGIDLPDLMPSQFRFLLAVNEPYCALTGYTKEEVLGKSCTLIIPDSIAAKHDSYMEGYFKTGTKRLIGTCVDAHAHHREHSHFSI